MSLNIPNGERIFLDINGDPLNAGMIYFYTPNTTEPKDTWVDEHKTAINTNPVVLDQAGRAVIWGDGLYRQVVHDQFGNLVWDRVTGLADLNLEFLSTGYLGVTGDAEINGQLRANNITTIYLGVTGDA